MNRLYRKALLFLPGVAFIVAVFAAIQVAASNGAVNKVIVPPPTAVVGVFWHLIVSGAFIVPLFQTLVLLFVGYGVGCALGVLLGILMGSFRPVYLLFEPLTELLRPIPKPALLPALMLFLGLGPSMKITIIALSTFFPVLVNAIQGTRAVDPTMLAMARTFGYRPAAIIWKIVLPAAAPYYLAGMRISLGIALVVVIIAEMLAGKGGIGFALLNNQRDFLVQPTYAWVLVLALLGLSLNALFTWMERRATFWHAPSST
ncbi:MAG TPA: ABC transporter permease [Candidatus Binatia bacterium]|nr:ABC transporter permease [Candidatus Binatia bacterium]